MGKKDQSDTLGNRMKMYEEVSKTKLMNRTPIIMRIDGKAFHTYTKKFKYLDSTLQSLPFSVAMHTLMTHTTRELIKQVQTCVFGYTQSDEISLLLRNYDTIKTEPWFDNEVQKLTSVGASIATAAFNQEFRNMFPNDNTTKTSSLAMFDCRVFTLPPTEVTNYFVWRQQDAIRNSVQMLGRHYLSSKQMLHKSNEEVKDILKREYSVDWSQIPTWMQIGTSITRTTKNDEQTPIFSNERSYVQQLVDISTSEELSHE